MLSSSVRRDRWTSEHALVAAAADGEAGAQEQLIETFMPRIAKAAAVYRNNSAVSRTDLLQDGVVGLLRALKRFDHSLGTPFWAYAQWWVRQAMQHLVAEMTREVVLSDRALRRLSRIKDARAVWLRTRGREPTVRELMDVCGCGRDDVERLLAVEMPSRRLDEPASLRDGAGDSLGERLADEASGDAYDAVLERTQLDGLRERCAQLPERERFIVYAHYGLQGPVQTLRVIASQLSLSVERVRQIEDGAFRKLRAEAEQPRLRPVDPGASPAQLRERLARELEAERCSEAVAYNLVSATHEVAAGVWQRGRPPRLVQVGRARGSVVCEVMDPAAGPGSAAAAAIVARFTSRIERFGSVAGSTYRLWG